MLCCDDDVTVRGHVLAAACSKEALRERLERMLLGDGERPSPRCSRDRVLVVCDGASQQKRTSTRVMAQVHSMRAYEGT